MNFMAALVVGMIEKSAILPQSIWGGTRLRHAAAQRKSGHKD
jgi:hypothetical protein